MPGVIVEREGYRVTQGQEQVSTYRAPILYGPPAYHSFFCSNCGSPLPDPAPTDDHLEIPAGLLDDDPGLKPDKHIFVEFLPGWDTIEDGLPQYDIKKLHLERHDRDLGEDFELRTHYDEPSGS